MHVTDRCDYFHETCFTSLIPSHPSFTSSSTSTFTSSFTSTRQNPEGFDPDRWAPDAADADKLKELFTPFSLGKRNCVGQNLANLETKLVLATLYKSFSFELTSEVVVDYFLTLKPVNAHMRVLSAKC